MSYSRASRVQRVSDDSVWAPLSLESLSIRLPVCGLFLC